MGKKLDGQYTRTLCAVSEHIREAVSHKTAVVWLLTSDL